MITSSRGDFAAIILLSTLAAGCPADEPNDDPTTSSTDTDPSTTLSTTDTTTTMSTTETPEGSSTDAPTESSGEDTTTTTDASSESSGADTSDDGSTTEAVALEIVGEWADEFGGEHVVTQDQWATTYAPDTFTYTITEYDNAERWIIAQDDGDETWSKYEWTYTEDDLWYCQTAFGEESPEDAMATPDADPADPAVAGCGGFAWSRLVPQR